MEDLPISEKEKMIQDLDYANHEKYKYKICASPLQHNIYQDCYREQLVSFFQMAPLMSKTVPLEKADYILYANPFARVQDFTDSVLKELEEINKKRKDGSEIIICGKATNIKPLIEGKYKNITYVPSHYTEYVGKRFEIEMKEQYVVYDDRNGVLNIWPVDGCLNKCGFCRRSYMYIPFESQSLESLKEQLDWYKKYHPEQMRFVSLRAENITQHGIDIDGHQTLHKVIDLVDSYDEVESIEFSIGLCLGEMNKNILISIGRSRKITGMALYLEAGNNRLLKMIGKKHTCEQAKKIIKIIREFHPEISISAAVMIGLPTEGLDDIISLAKLLMECDIDYILCNYYRFSPKHLLAIYEQLSEQVKKMHLIYLIKYIKSHYNKDTIMELCHETFYDSSKRSVVRNLERIKKEQKDTKGRIWYNATYEYFMGNNIVIKSHNSDMTEEELHAELKHIINQKKRCL